MPDMAGWFGQLERRFQIPEQERGIPLDGGGRDFSTPTAPVTPDPAAPPVSPPTTNTSPDSTLSPALRDWLLQYASGHNVLTDEMYNYFRGDDILQQVLKFDPNARWTETDISGGEGGGQGRGRRLDFDPRTLPAVGGPGLNNSIFDTGFVPVYDNSNLHHPGMTYDDPYYGRLTPYANVVQEKTPWWVTAAPIAVSLLAPYAAGALAAGGIGAGVATGAVTGSGVAAGAAGTPWWASALGKAPMAAKAASSYWGTPDVVRPTPGNAITPPTYDPTAFGQTGNTPTKPSSNDSSLVATAFADDPYGFSNRRP